MNRPRGVVVQVKSSTESGVPLRQSSYDSFATRRRCDTPGALDRLIDLSRKLRGQEIPTLDCHLTGYRSILDHDLIVANENDHTVLTVQVRPNDPQPQARRRNCVQTVGILIASRILVSRVTDGYKRGTRVVVRVALPNIGTTAQNLRCALPIFRIGGNRDRIAQKAVEIRVRHTLSEQLYSNDYCDRYNDGTQDQ